MSQTISDHDKQLMKRLLETAIPKPKNAEKLILRKLKGAWTKLQGGKIISDQDVKNRQKNAKGGKIKKRASGGRVKKSK